MSDFTDNLGVRTLTFFERVREFDHIDAVLRCVEDEVRSLGFDFVTCAAVPGPATSPLRGMLMNTRPDAFIQRYIAKDYVRIDPAITELQRTLRPFSWSDLRQSGLISKSRLRIVDEGSEFGMRDGMTIPIVSHDGSISVFCPSGSKPDMHPRIRSAIELVAIGGHQAMKRVLLKGASVSRLLTPREREVLSWVAHGMNDDEIGDKLGISTTTATKHVVNAMRKLNSGKRTMAVVEAIRLREIKI